MSNAEYMEWQEYYQIEPFGLPMHDLMHAHHMSLLANANRNKEVQPEPFTTKDFLLYPLFSEKEEEEAKEEPTVDGLTADEWGLLHFFQAVKAENERKARELNKGADPETAPAQNS